MQLSLKEKTNMKKTLVCITAAGFADLVAFGSSASLAISAPIGALIAGGITLHDEK